MSGFFVVWKVKLDNKPSGRYVMPMNTETGRKKEPELVRRKILHAVGRIVVAKGMGAVSLDAVAREAGVSKGGLMHHFPSRQALIEAFFASLLAVLDVRIAACLTADAEPRGRFTRAYVTVVTGGVGEGEEGRTLTAAALAACFQPELAALWTAWVREGLARCGEDDHSLPGKIARYAADGIWLEDCAGTGPAETPERGAVIRQLLAMTRTI